jgi:hypothetical protein
MAVSLKESIVILSEGEADKAFIEKLMEQRAISRPLIFLIRIISSTETPRSVTCYLRLGEIQQGLHVLRAY